MTYVTLLPSKSPSREVISRNIEKARLQLFQAALICRISLLVRDFAAYSVIDMDRTVETADWGITSTGV